MVVVVGEGLITKAHQWMQSYKVSVSKEQNIILWAPVTMEPNLDQKQRGIRDNRGCMGWNEVGSKKDSYENAMWAEILDDEGQKRKTSFGRRDQGIIKDLQESWDFEKWAKTKMKWEPAGVKELAISNSCWGL